MFAFSQLELGGSAKVKGRLSYSLLKLEPGAVFEGVRTSTNKISAQKQRVQLFKLALYNSPSRMSILICQY